MEYQDRVVKCVDCESDFVFTAGEQLFYADKGFKNEPKRCKPCKAKRNQLLGGEDHRRTETTTMCSRCGKETTVPSGVFSATACRGDSCVIPRHKKPSPPGTGPWVSPSAERACARLSVASRMMARGCRADLPSPLFVPL